MDGDNFGGGRVRSAGGKIVCIRKMSQLEEAEEGNGINTYDAKIARFSGGLYAIGFESFESVAMLAAKGGLGLVIGTAGLGFVALDFREGGGNVRVFQEGNRHFVSGGFFGNDFAEFDAPEGLLDGGGAELFPEGVGHLLEALILDRSAGAVIGAKFAEVFVVLGGVLTGDYRHS